MHRAAACCRWRRAWIASSSMVEAEAILSEAVDAYRAALGDRLIAAYALGSLAQGGFSALVSDVDLGLMLADPVQSQDGERSRGHRRDPEGHWLGVGRAPVGVLARRRRCVERVMAADSRRWIGLT
jgi:hypothetical protein